ncbi:galactokinase [Konateibacter massiliensis]|uniref:galactokinase n=1 Tax=Konateibacter massiliensis TaxID=2002841 RepID=UPI000C148116|nr:galactokinase family protein [Konateibacter massiliensis]
MKTNEIFETLKTKECEELFSKMYGREQVDENRKRYEDLITGYEKRYGAGENIEIYSAPGRTELGGNHTDHNNGKVLAGSINLDCVGVASIQDGDTINIVSVDYDLDFSINVNTLQASIESSTAKLVCGLLEGVQKRGHKIGGFHAYISSNVISAAGVSSSASFEMLLCAIINDLFNDNSLDMVEYAKIGQYAENHNWNKSSGLLDQMACAVGGIIHIDFKNEEMPIVSQMNIDFYQEGYGIVIVNTGKSHADLSEEYSLVPKEMKSVANYFGKTVCAEISLEDIVNNIEELRKQVGDRAVLRAIHFCDENGRVDKQVEALQKNNFDQFLHLVAESGNSSWKLLQNCYSIENYNEQGIPLALTLTKMFLDKKGRGVCRVHGGGFAGVIMAIVSLEDMDEYVAFMENKFLKNSTYKMIIRPYGAINVLKLI